MDRQNFQQSCAVKFCVKLGESATVTYGKLQRDYGEHSLSKAQVFRWHKSFLEGREQVEDEPHAGRPSTSKADDNVERVRSLVRSHRRLTLRMISSELNLNRNHEYKIYKLSIYMASHPRKTDISPGATVRTSKSRKWKFTPSLHCPTLLLCHKVIFTSVSARIFGSTTECGKSQPTFNYPNIYKIIKGIQLIWARHIIRIDCVAASEILTFKF